jgi:hypothetical protein
MASFAIVCDVTAEQDLATRLDEACSEKYAGLPTAQPMMDALKAAAVDIAATLAFPLEVLMTGSVGEPNVRDSAELVVRTST